MVVMVTRERFSMALVFSSWDACCSLATGSTAIHTSCSRVEAPTLAGTPILVSMVYMYHSIHSPPDCFHRRGHRQGFPPGDRTVVLGCCPGHTWSPCRASGTDSILSPYRKDSSQGKANSTSQTSGCHYILGWRVGTCLQCHLYDQHKTLVWYRKTLYSIYIF